MTANRLPADPVDLFALLYDSLAEDRELYEREADHWPDLPGFEETASQVEQMAYSDGEVDETRLPPFLGLDGAPRRLAVLVGIDRALAYVNPRQDTIDVGIGNIGVGALGPVLRRYAREGRFSTANVSGAVLPRLTWPARPDHQPTLAEAFTAVIRVSEGSWRAISHERLRGSQDLPSSSRQIRIGVAPLLHSLNDVDIRRVSGCSRDPKTGKEVDGYVLRPVDGEGIRARIRGILSSLTKEKAVIGVLPEASLCNSLLSYWQELLRELDQDPSADPHRCWILVGTGPVGQPTPTGKLPNQAVVLDQSGEKVFSQDKVRDFSLTPKVIKSWGLDEKLDNTELAVEWISRGSKIEVRESFAGRIAILICEDITGPLSRSVLEDCGVSHLLVPIFAGPLKGEWEFPRSEAQEYVRQIGSWVLAVNSLVTARVAAEEEPIFGLLTGPSPTSSEEWGECHLQFIRYTAPCQVEVVTVPPDIA